MYYTEEELEYYMQEAYNMGQEDLMDYINEGYYDDGYDSAFDQVMWEARNLSPKENFENENRKLNNTYSNERILPLVKRYSDIAYGKNPKKRIQQMDALPTFEALKKYRDSLK